MRAGGQNLKRLLKKRGWGRLPLPAEGQYASFLVAFGGLRVLFWSTGLFFLPIDSTDLIVMA